MGRLISNSGTRSIFWTRETAPRLVYEGEIGWNTPKANSIGETASHRQGRVRLSD